MSLLAVCVPFLEKCLLILFAHYKMGLFIFSLLGCKRNIYSHKTQSLISHMICNFFFFCFVGYLFTFWRILFAPKFLTPMTFNLSSSL